MKSFFKYVFATITGVTIMVGILFLGIFGAVASLSKGDNKVDYEDAVLHVELNYPLMDRTQQEFQLISALDPEIDAPLGLYSMLKTIEHAKDDDGVKGIFLDLTMLNAGFGKLSEVRNAILDFKSSGKFVVAYAEVYYNQTIYLASAADKVYLNPKGTFIFNGMLADVTFVKDALENLGISLQPIKRGKFKGAVEPFVLDELSAENRKQIDAYLNSVYKNFITDISSERGMTYEELDRVADEMLVKLPSEAVKHNLVDDLLYRDQVYEEINVLLEKDKSEKVKLVKVGKYAQKGERSSEGKDQIAIVFAEGSIVNGKGGSDEIGGDTYAATLRELRENDKIKAVVLRINSGGGAALASEVIWREASLLREKKPLIVSMGDVAASGGYYIACMADTILALPTTITGSIGVFGLFPNVKGLMDKIGVHNEYIGTGKHSEFGRIDRPLTPTEFQVIDTIIARTYESFLTRVSEGRDMTIAQADSIGQGRVWTGEMAKERRLIDAYGGVVDAVNIAAYKANSDAFLVKAYPKRKGPLEELFGQMDPMAIKKDMLKAELGDSYRYYELVKQAQQMNGVQTVMPFTIHIH